MVILATFEAYYDTVLDITWLADGFYGKTSGPYAFGIYEMVFCQRLGDKSESVRQRHHWLATTMVSPIDGTTADDGTTSSNIGTEDIGANLSAPGTLYAGSTASEMAHSFYQYPGQQELLRSNHIDGVFLQWPQFGSDQTNTASVSYILPTFYWTATEYATATRFAWVFNLGGANKFTVVNSVCSMFGPYTRVMLVLQCHQQYLYPQRCGYLAAVYFA